MTTVGILYCNPAPGASEDELDVLVQVELVESALRELGYTTERIFFVPDLNNLREAIRILNVSVLFNLVESIEGKGRHIYLAPAFMEIIGIYFCGCGAHSMALTTDKVLSKKLMRVNGIPTAEWCTVDDVTRFTAHTRYIVKCVDEDASIGIDANPLIATATPAELIKKLKQKREATKLNLFAESFVDGKEFSIAITGSQIVPTLYPVTERVFDQFKEHGKLTIYNYDAKWDTSSFEYQHNKLVICDDSDEPDLYAKLRSTALQCWNIFGCEGYARVDFRVDAAGNVWVLEVNPNPGLSLDSTITLAALGSGLTYARFIERILDSCHR